MSLVFVFLVIVISNYKKWENSNMYLLVSMLKKLLQYQNLHSVDLQEDELNDIFNKIKSSRKIEKSANNFEGSPCLDWNLQEDYNPELEKSKRVRCLNEFLNESQPDTVISLNKHFFFFYL